MDPHSVCEPELLHGGLACLLGKLQQAAASAVSRSAEQQLSFRPHRQADVQAPVSLMGMAPKQAAVFRIESCNNIAQENHELILPIHVDDERRRRRGSQALLLPSHGT